MVLKRHSPAPIEVAADHYLIKGISLGDKRSDSSIDNQTKDYRKFQLRCNKSAFIFSACFARTFAAKIVEIQADATFMDSERKSLLTSSHEEDEHLSTNPKKLVQLKTTISKNSNNGDENGEERIETSFSDEPDFIVKDYLRDRNLKALILKSYIIGIFLSTLAIPPLYYGISYLHPSISILGTTLSLPFSLVLLVYTPMAILIRCCSQRTLNPFCIVFFIPALGLVVAWCICLSIFRYHIPILDSAAKDISPKDILNYSASATLFTFSYANITTQYEMGNSQLCVAPLVAPTWNRLEDITAWVVCEFPCEKAADSCGWNKQWEQAETFTNMNDISSVMTLINTAQNHYQLKAAPHGVAILVWESEVLQRYQKELNAATNGFVPITVIGAVLWLATAIFILPAFILKAPKITYGPSCLKVLDQ